MILSLWLYYLFETDTKYWRLQRPSTARWITAAIWLYTEQNIIQDNLSLQLFHSHVVVFWRSEYQGTACEEHR